MGTYAVASVRISGLSYQHSYDKLFFFFLVFSAFYQHVFFFNPLNAKHENTKQTCQGTLSFCDNESNPTLSQKQMLYFGMVIVSTKQEK